MSVTYVKFCPRCQTSTRLDTAICVQCGHQYRSHLAAPTSEKTIAMTRSQAPGIGETSFQPLPASLRRTRRIPRPLLGIVAVVIAACGLTGVAVHRADRAAIPVHDGAAAPMPTNTPPYDVIFQSSPGQRMAPVATQNVADLQRWLKLQPSSAAAGSADSGKSDYPETVHLYMSKRILLIPAGTQGRVLTQTGQWRQVRILSGEYLGTTGFAPQNSVSRPGMTASASPRQTLTIP